MSTDVNPRQNFGQPVSGIFQPDAQFIDGQKPMELDSNHIARPPFDRRADRILRVQPHQNIGCAISFCRSQLKLGPALRKIQQLGIGRLFIGAERDRYLVEL